MKIRRVKGERKESKNNCEGEERNIDINITKKKKKNRKRRKRRRKRKKRRK